MCCLEFKHFKTFNFHDGSEGKQRPNYMLDLRNFVVAKLADDGTLVPKHVGVCFVICFVFNYSILLVFKILKILEEEKLFQRG